MTEKDKIDTEQVGQALYDYLSDFYNASRHSWMHDFFNDKFKQGRDYSLTELALIPEVRAALDAIDKELGSELEKWHGVFKSMRESPPEESQ